MSDDIEWEGPITSVTVNSPDFFVATDATIAQYLRSSDGSTGSGFAFLVFDFDKEDPGNIEKVEQRQLSIAMTDTDFYPHFIREVITQLPCEELRDELLQTLDNHKHKE